MINMVPGLRTLGWGLYLTSSWTWCIGMWLPLVLIGMYGWPGFWVFAVPNVLGCAAMGYLIRSRAESKRLVELNRGAMRWFSVATIAFQLFFLAYIFGKQGWMFGCPDGTITGIAIPLIAYVVAVGLSRLPWCCWIILGSLAFVASMITWAILGTHFTRQIQDTGTEPALELWPLAPLIILGFLACPWLDPTFHRARQESPSRHAFGIFGLAFLAVLLFVTGYFHIDLPAPWGLILLFFIYQTTFTMGAHLKEIRLLAGPGGLGGTWLLSLLPLVGAAIGIGGWMLLSHVTAEAFLEDTYLRFLALYGLVFPAWILAFMLLRSRPTASRLLTVVAAVALALPLAELGMIQGSRWWLVPSVLLVIGGGAVASRIGKPPVA